MISDLLRNNVKPQAYRTLFNLLGEPEEMQSLREELEQLRRQLASAQSTDERARTELQAELERCRQEKMEVLAKESSTRKELQDCQTRAQDLLEQVVQLTHQKRASAKDLLDQKFRTEATPLERNRFEMELTEARGNARRAEQRAEQAAAEVKQANKRVKEAEERLAHCQKELGKLRRKAERNKKLEADLAWARKQAAAHLDALSAAIAHIRGLEQALDVRATAEARAETGRRSYRKPDLRPASADQQASFAERDAG